MSGNKMKRMALASLVSACVFGAGWRAGAQTPTSQPAPQKPIAVINGHEIDNQKFNELLMQVCGLRVFETVLNWTIVQQACNQAGIQTDNQDFAKLVNAEIQRVLDAFAANGVSEADRPKFLQAVLQKQGISNVEFQMSMQQQAGLRALSKGHVDVTDAEVKQRFEADYGEKAEVRIVRIPDGSQPALMTAAKVREAVEKQKKDVTEAGRELGLSVENVRIPKNADGPGIKEIRDTAFQLKPGQLSATVPQGNVSYLIYLDKIDPAQPDVKFDSVKEKVRQEVQTAKEQQWMANHLMYLRSQARVDVNDPVLAREFAVAAAQMKAAQAAATQAASQPATQPAK
ncbi:MAG: peptidyl-prolyl cis-trans isomerase [Phycisphaerae bacterium]